MYASEMWPVKVQHEVQSDKTEMSLVRSDGNVALSETSLELEPGSQPGGFNMWNIKLIVSKGYKKELDRCDS